MGAWGKSLILQEFEWELMSVIVRVKKFKNFLENLLGYWMCHKYFGGDFLIFFALEFCNFFL